MFAWPTQIPSCLNSCFSLPKYCLFFFSHLKATITWSPCFSLRSLIIPYSTTQALGHSLPVTHWQCEHVSLNSHLAFWVYILLSDLTSIFQVLPWVFTGETVEGNSWNMSLKFGWIIMLEDRERSFSFFFFFFSAKCLRKNTPEFSYQVFLHIHKNTYVCDFSPLSYDDPFLLLKGLSLSWAIAQEDCSDIACNWE